MSFQLHEPQPPQQLPQPAVTPLVYVTEPVVWQYKQLMYELNRVGFPDEEALNRLGEEGWELVTVLVHAGRARYLFKRVSG